jgi:hypothetical protein
LILNTFVNVYIKVYEKVLKLKPAALLAKVTWQSIGKHHPKKPAPQAFDFCPFNIRGEYETVNKPDN